MTQYSLEVQQLTKHLTLAVISYPIGKLFVMIKITMVEYQFLYDQKIKLTYCKLRSKEPTPTGDSFVY